jgi:hypothetical protein
VPCLGGQCGDKDVDKFKIPEVVEVISDFVGLVVVDDSSDVIRLVHYTTQEIFLNEPEKTGSQTLSEKLRRLYSHISRFTLLEMARMRAAWVFGTKLIAMHFSATHLNTGLST